jgi:hypothetical protein
VDTSKEPSATATPSPRWSKRSREAVRRNHHLHAPGAGLALAPPRPPPSRRGARLGHGRQRPAVRTRPLRRKLSRAAPATGVGDRSRRTGTRADHRRLSLRKARSSRARDRRPRASTGSLQPDPRRFAHCGSNGVAAPHPQTQERRGSRSRAGGRLQFVQPRSAGVGSRRARSRVNAGVVRGPVCRTLIGHFIGQVLRDTRAVRAAERQRDAGRVPARGSASEMSVRRQQWPYDRLERPTTMSSRLAISH